MEGEQKKKDISAVQWGFPPLNHNKQTCKTSFPTKNNHGYVVWHFPARTTRTRGANRFPMQHGFRFWSYGRQPKEKPSATRCLQFPAGTGSMYSSLWVSKPHWTALGFFGPTRKRIFAIMKGSYPQKAKVETPPNTSLPQP